MPIGKNSLKRVTNNGYSSVKSTAPDMENSEIVSEVKESAPAPEKTSEVKKAPAKPATKKPASTAKKTETAKPAEKKTESKGASTAKKAPAKKPSAKPEAKAETKPEVKVSATVIPAPKEVVMAVIDSGKSDVCEKPYCNVGDKMPHFLL